MLLQYKTWIKSQLCTSLNISFVLLPEGANFSNILDKAIQADGHVKERYQTHRDTISLLCKPEPELNAAIPSANPAKTMQGSEVRQEN